MPERKIPDFTDMRMPAGWKFIPARVRPYLELARLDRPIGIWLLLFPCWWGLALEGGAGSRFYLLFALGAIVMRGAGCTLNDIIDRRIDAEVERTRGRPLPSGRIGVKAAMVFLCVELLLGLLVLRQFPPRTVYLGVAALALVAIYPFMKRITFWPQIVLGFAFNWGALLGGITAAGHLSAPVWLLYAAGIFWTLGYDTIYAHQDKRDDARIGIGSTARRLGDGKSAVVLFYGLFFLSLLAAGYLAHLNIGFYLLTAVGALLTTAQLISWRPDSPADCLLRFKANRWLGLIVFAALIRGSCG